MGLCFAVVFLCWTYCEEGRQLGLSVRRLVRNVSPSLRRWTFFHPPEALHRWQHKD